MNKSWRNIVLWLGGAFIFFVVVAMIIQSSFLMAIFNVLTVILNNSVASAALFGTITSIGLAAIAVFSFIRSRNLSTSPGLESEAASTERQVATTAESLTREFEARIRGQINAAVSELAATSDQTIKTQLRETINQSIGANLISVLGERLAAETSEASRIAKFSQETDDVFVGMRNRTVQYAQSANIQSTYFRLIGISLSLAGLTVLGAILYLNLRQFFEHPEIKIDNWEMLVARNAPSSAFVALSEFLALIMFRYQSKSLEYMRYFSNEATNLDARKIAFMSAIYFSDKTAMNKLIERFEKTERNFLIGKDQRTLELANNINEDLLFDKLRSYFSTSVREDSTTQTPPAPRPRPRTNRNGARNTA